MRGRGALAWPGAALLSRSGPQPLQADGDDAHGKRAARKQASHESYASPTKEATFTFLPGWEFRASLPGY